MAGKDVDTNIMLIFTVNAALQNQTEIIQKVFEACR